jgi:hypothetical protein
MRWSVRRPVGRPGKWRPFICCRLDSRWRRRGQRRRTEGWVAKVLPPLGESDHRRAAEQVERHGEFPTLAVNRKSPDEPKNDRRENGPRQPIAQTGAERHRPGSARIECELRAENERNHAPSGKGECPPFQQGDQLLSEFTPPGRDDSTPAAIPSGRRSRNGPTGGRRLRQGRPRCHCLPPRATPCRDRAKASRPGQTRGYSSAQDQQR